MRSQNMTRSEPHALSQSPVILSSDGPLGGPIKAMRPEPALAALCKRSLSCLIASPQEISRSEPSPARIIGLAKRSGLYKPCKEAWPRAQIEP